jgi:hypothetical protein
MDTYDSDDRVYQFICGRHKLSLHDLPSHGLRHPWL